MRMTPHPPGFPRRPSDNARRRVVARVPGFEPGACRLGGGFRKPQEPNKPLHPLNNLRFRSGQWWSQIPSRSQERLAVWLVEQSATKTGPSRPGTGATLYRGPGSKPTANRIELQMLLSTTKTIIDSLPEDSGLDNDQIIEIVERCRAVRTNTNTIVRNSRGPARPDPQAPRLHQGTNVRAAGSHQVVHLHTPQPRTPPPRPPTAERSHQPRRPRHRSTRAPEDGAGRGWV